MAEKTAADPDKGNASAGDGGHAKPPRKTRRAVSHATTKATATTRSRRKLTALFELPLDIVYEIFSHLHPAHLLAVSRTNKALRGMLMCKNARSVWRKSFLNAPDIPPVPEDLNEPQYARLLFDKSCMSCQAPNTSTVAWASRWRCCKKCFPYDFWAEYDFFRLVELLPYERELTEVIPGSLLKDKFGDLVLFYNKEQVKAFLTEGEQYWKDPEKAKIWVEEKVARCKKQKEHGDLLLKWDNARQISRAQQLDDIRHERQQAIFERLRQLGWGEEVEKSGPQLILHSQVSKAQPLTDYGWYKIKDSILSHIKTLRDARLEKEKAWRYQRLSDAYDAFLLTQPPDAVFPAVGNLVNLEHIRRAIEDTPVEVEVSDDAIRQLIEDIPPAWFTDWRARCDQILLDKITNALGDIAPTDLNLATIFFAHTPSYAIASSQARIVRYPDVLTDPAITDELDKEARETRLRTGFMPWSARGVKFSMAAHAHARFFVECAGLDPGAATAEDMDRRDPWYAFDALDGAYTYVARWPHVVRDGMHVSAFEPLSEERAASFRYLIRQMDWQPEFHGRLACCAHCGAPFRESEALYEHLYTEHQLLFARVRDFRFLFGGKWPAGSLRFEQGASMTVHVS